MRRQGGRRWTVWTDGVDIVDVVDSVDTVDGGSFAHAARRRVYA